MKYLCSFVEGLLTIFVWVCFWDVFCSIVQCVFFFFFPVPHCLAQYNFADSFQSSNVNPLTLFFSLSVVLATLHFVPFHINFSYNCLRNLHKITYWDCIKSIDQVEKNGIVTILSLPIHEYNILHLFRSLIYFIRILWLSSYRF